ELDRAWLAYMKERPLTARGYIDNAHGNWLKKVMEKAHEEEVRVRAEATKGHAVATGPRGGVSEDGWADGPLFRSRAGRGLPRHSGRDRPRVSGHGLGEESPRRPGRTPR